MTRVTFVLRQLQITFICTIYYIFRFKNLN